MQPRDRLTAKEIQVATLVWQGLTNKDIARVLITSEQVVKNYLRTAFDKLGVWTRLELALYVAKGHGGANWHMQLGFNGGYGLQRRLLDGLRFDRATAGRIWAVPHPGGS
jgi:DNA-binding CsgD family transcriptional regulator